MAETTRFLTAVAYTHTNFMDRDKLALTNGARAGVESELAPTATGADMNVNIAAGRAFLDGLWYDNSASIAVAQTADPADPRINRVVLRWLLATGEVTVELLAGVAAGAPVAPALTWDANTKEISLCQVYVDAAAATIAQADITDERMFMPAAGPLVLEKMYNDSGAACALGTVVVADVTGDRYFNTTTTARDLGVLGVVAEDDGIASTATGRIVTHGMAFVNMDAATTRGNFIRASGTATKATPTANPELGVFGRALATTAGAGLCLCELWGAVIGATITPTAYCVVAYDADANVPTNTVDTDAIEDAAVTAAKMGAKAQITFTWYIYDSAEVGQLLLEYVAPFAVVLTGGYIIAGTAPTGAALIVDVHTGAGAGTTVFTTQGNRPTLAAASAGPTAIVAPDVTNIPAGTRLVAYVDQIGSTLSGANVTVELVGTYALV